MITNILVVATHQDKEILGCYGTIAVHARCGDEVLVVIITDGVTSRNRQRDAESQRGNIARLANATRKADTVLGAASVTIHNRPNYKTDSRSRLDAIKLVQEEIAWRRPALAYTHHASDLNTDHRSRHTLAVQDHTERCRSTRKECK